MIRLPKLLCLATFAAAPLFAQGIQPLAAADAPAAEIFRQTGSTAMVMVVVRDKEVHMQGFGAIAPGDTRGPGPDSLLRLCSLTKIFATDLLVKMVDDRTVRLDDALQLYAPAGRLVPVATMRGPAARAITLGDLATHTAGLPREITLPVPAGTHHFTFPDFDTRWAWLPKQKLRTSPGTAALYSNMGFDLLGDALADAAHKPYPKLLADRTTTPLGMKDTTFTPTAAQCTRLLLGFHAVQHPDGCTPTDESAGSAGLYSTPADMATWLQYLLGISALLQNPAAQAAYVQPGELASVKGLDHAGTPEGIGLGWMLLDAPVTAEKIVEKTGGGGGFTTYIALDHEHRTAIFIALTEGNAPWHVNPFRETNNILLGLAGLPPMLAEPVRVVAARPVRSKRAARPPARGKAAAARNKATTAKTRKPAAKSVKAAIKRKGKH